jgi:hypothetical protein
VTALHCTITRPCHTRDMATYKISDLGSTGYRVAATKDSGMLHMCGGLATEDDVERWVEAHKRATEAEDRTDKRPSPTPHP